MRQLLEQAQHIGSDGVNAARNTKCSGPRWTACEGERMGNAPKTKTKRRAQTQQTQTNLPAPPPSLTPVTVYVCVCAPEGISNRSLQIVRPVRYRRCAVWRVVRVGVSLMSISSSAVPPSFSLYGIPAHTRFSVQLQTCC